MRLCTPEFTDGSSLAQNHGIVGAHSANPNWSRTATTLEKHAVVQESSPVCGQYKQARRVCDSLSVTCRSESRQRMTWPHLGGLPPGEAMMKAAEPCLRNQPWSRRGLVLDRALGSACPFSGAS